MGCLESLGTETKCTKGANQRKKEGEMNTFEQKVRGQGFARRLKELLSRLGNSIEGRKGKEKVIL